MVAVVPADGDEPLARASDALARELEEGLSGFSISVARSRLAVDPADVYRAGQEALLAANVGEAEGAQVLAFEETGAYRLLLPASEDPAELGASTRRRWSRWSRTTSSTRPSWWARSRHIWRTTGTWPRPRSSCSPTATIRYRLERARELCGHDVTSTEGRELGLGLKAMRVLGIAPRLVPPEPGTEGGRVPPPESE